MRQLKVKDLIGILEGMPQNSIIYIGDDEELNGLHSAYFCQKVSKKSVKSISYGALDEAGVLIS